MHKNHVSKLKRTISGLLALTMTTGLTAVVPASADSLAGSSKTYYGDGYNVRYDVVSEWGDHSNVNVTLTNTSDEPIKNWALKYDTNGDIENIWNGIIFGCEEDISIIKNAGYNYEIMPGSSVSFGYTLVGAYDLPESIVLSSQRKEYEPNEYTVTLNVGSDWGTGFTGNVELSAVGDEPIEAWRMSFDTNFELTSVWNSAIINAEGNSYTAQSTYSTAFIQPGETVSFGLNGTKDSDVVPEISNISMNGVVVDGDAAWENTDDSSQAEENSEDESSSQADTSSEAEESSAELSSSSADSSSKAEGSSKPDDSSKPDTETKKTDEFSITAYGGYNADENAIEIEWYSSVGGEYEVLVSDDNEDYESLVKESQFDFYCYHIDEDFDTKYFKVRVISDGKYAETIPFSVNRTADGYEIGMIDSDGDGLFDVYEKMLGTNINEADTDNDGLTDHQEVYITGTDPTDFDSVTENVADADADPDDDGLSIIAELSLGTNLNSADTDGDGLTDGDEVNNYGTDPLDPDTDDDDISDGDEVKLGLDPGSGFSDGKTSDKKRKFEQHIGKDSEVLSLINTDDNAFKVSLDITASGNALTSLIADESGYSNVIESDMVLGVVPEFKYEEGFAVDDVVLNFDIEDSFTENTNGRYAAVSRDFESIKRFNVFKYFEDIDMLLPIETTYDTENNRVTTHVDELGTYCLIDMEKWFEKLGIEPDEFVTVNISPSAVSMVGIPVRATMLLSNPTEVNRNVDIIFNVYPSETACDDIIDSIKTAGRKLYETYGSSDKVRIYVVNASGSAYTTANGENYADNYSELEEVADQIRYLKSSSGLSFDNFLRKFYNKTALRENADKYYFDIESLLVGEKDVKPSSLAERFFNDHVTASVCCFIPEQHIVFADKTSGQNFNSSMVFGNDVAEFIIGNYMPWTDNNYSIVIPTGWKRISLDKPITGEYKAVLDDYSENELYDFSDRSIFADTDGDGLIDLREINYRINNVDVIEWDENGNAILPTLPQIIFLESETGHDYLTKALCQYEGFDLETFVNIRLLPIKSDPTEKDTDFDGKTDKDDTYPLNPVFEGKVNISDKIVDQKNSSKNELKYKKIYDYSFNTEFNIDYRAFYKNSSLFDRKLSVFGSVLAALAYDSSRISDNSNGESMDIKKFFESCGIEKLTTYDLADEYNDDDISKLYLGHNSVEYDNEKKDIFFVVVRGTPMSSVAEWSSNFDVGADTDEYYSAMGLNRTNNDWRNKENHKGFDVTANRFYDRIIDDINTYNTDGEKIIYIVGHSRGAAVSNILGAKFIDETNYKTFVYTYATPNTTTKSSEECASYDSIFNIVNKDDMVPCLPMSKEAEQWGEEFGFTKYGKTLSSISIDKSYENEWLKLVDGAFANYNSNGNLENTLSSLSAIATKREELYKYSNDVNSYYSYIAYDLPAIAIKNQIDKYSFRLNRFCKVSYFDTPWDGIISVSVHQTPAFLMMSLSEMAAGYMDRGEDSIMGSAAGYFVAPIYEDAKKQFCFSGADAIYNDSILQIGGMIDPHVPVSYYLLSQKVSI